MPTSRSLATPHSSGGGEAASRSLVEAIAACEGLHHRGFDFLRPDGSEQKMSFHALQELVRLRARQLADHGAGPGHRVALMIPDGALFITTFLGAAWAGATPVPLYPPGALGRLEGYLEAIDAVLRAAAPTLLCTTRALLGAVEPLAARLPGLSLLAIDELPLPSSPLAGLDAVAPDDLAFLQFTSGSTSAPRGVMVTNRTLAANVEALRRWLKIDSEHEQSVSWLPLYHDMGLIGIFMASLFARANATFIPTSSFARNANIWLETIHRKRGTLTSAPNFALALAVKRARPERIATWDLSSLRILGCGAEPINPEVLRQFAATFAPAKLRPEAILPCYGMAEATLVISGTSLGSPFRTERVVTETLESDRRAELAQATGAPSREVVGCGTVVEGHEVVIVDAEGRTLPERSVGQVLFKGPSVTPGYFRAPDATAALLRDGWLETGDLGYLAGGELYIVGREKDLVIIHGRNHDPARIEWCVHALPGVRSGTAVAFTRPGPATEELVIAVEPAPPVDPVELVRAIGAAVLRELQLPVSDVVLVGRGRTPRTTSGKIQRSKTRLAYLAGTLHARSQQPAGIE